ncbi:MAG: 4-hydroxybenzoate octaprenyltransferase [Burkholderiales bacterium]
MDLASVAKKLDAYERLIRLDKPIGTLLLLWPTLWAVWLAANGRPTLTVVIVFVIGTLLMRSAGCAVNDFADRGFDPHVERTRTRPLATGEIKPGEALAVGALLALLAFCLVLFLNRFAILLSLLALAIAVSYPFSKRIFSLPQAYLGIAFGFGIPMAYAAVLNRLPLDCWALLAANIFWSIAYDTEYAMVDRDDDRNIGIRTAALTLGRFDVATVMACYAAMIALLAWVGAYLHLRWPYYAGLGVAAILMGYHYFLIRGRSREGCFKAFRHNNWVGAVIFAGIVLSYSLPLSAAHWR